MIALAVRPFCHRYRRAVAALLAVLTLLVVAHHAMPEAMAPMGPATPMAPMGPTGHDGAGGRRDTTAMILCGGLAALGGLIALAARAYWRLVAPLRVAALPLPFRGIAAARPVRRSRAPDPARLWCFASEAAPAVALVRAFRDGRLLGARRAHPFERSLR